MKLLVAFVALLTLLVGCAFVDEVATAMKDPTQLENVSDEAAAVAVGAGEAIETLSRDPTLTGAIAAGIALLTAGGGYYLRRKFLKKKTATIPTTQ